MKKRLPSFGAYLILHNAEQNLYPWRECIENTLEYADRVYVLEANSTDDTLQRLTEAFGKNDKVVIASSATPWDMDDTCVIGRKKQEARSLVKEDYCIYLDSDEILVVKNKNDLYDLVLQHTNIDVYSLPYITFFGSPYKIANFKDAENYWRWKIFKNLPHIGHGPHAEARKYDSNGRLYIDKTISDGCEIINMQTLEVMRSMLYMPPQYIQAGEMLRKVPTSWEDVRKIGLVFSEVMNDFSMVCLHYGWVSFENKAKNATNYWTKTKAYKDGAVEHSRLFDGLNEDMNRVMEVWQAIPTVPLSVRKHPNIMKPRLAMQLKPKVLNIGLSASGPFGVPKWGRDLAHGLSEYDVQTFAFSDYNTQSPPNALEFHKADSFVKYIKQNNLDKDALVIFGDGFWASTYPGPAKVVSVVHGLWSHPDREKWGDDGLREQRKALFDYQISYYKEAKNIGHTLICVSPFIHRVLKEQYGIDTILIPNAVDLKLFDSIRVSNVDKERPLILHGITSHNKGLDILPDVANHPLIKDKFDIASVDEIAKHINAPKEVAFKVADIAFLPTKWEASSYLLLECMANNLPIVSYRAGILNCKDLAHMDGVGTILDEYSADAFAKAIVDTYENRLKYAMGRLFVKDNGMTLDDWNARMKKLIYEVL